MSIADGDIIELIPGHHFFKYVTLSRSQKRVSNDGATNRELSSKKMRQQVCTSFYELNLLLVSICFTKFAFLCTNAWDEQDNENGKNSEEALCNFHVSHDKLPSTFRLLRVQGLPAWANTSCVSIRDVIQVMILSLVVMRTFFKFPFGVTCISSRI